MARVIIGKVRGDDGFNPEVTVYEDNLKSYRLKVKDATHEFLTPNLRGATFKSGIVEVWDSDVPTIVPFGDLGLDPSKDYMFYASAGIDYPPLRSIIAIRVGDAVHISVYTDTVPYSIPQLGSPFQSDEVKIGQPDLTIGDFFMGVQTDAESFPVNLLCFELEAVA